MKSLLFKDFKNASQALLPAMLLGIPLFLVAQFASENATKWPIADATKFFWIIYFFSTTSLYYRSFSQEGRSKNFILYTALRISKTKVFLSQAFVQTISAVILGIILICLAIFFWGLPEVYFKELLPSVMFYAAASAPLGTLLGLCLHTEREIFFPLVVLPLQTPLILAATHWNEGGGWIRVGLTFAVLFSFGAALFFEFFFDDLTEKS